MTKLSETSDFIYKLLLSLAIIIAIIIGMILGIQFMVASADEKAKVKEALIPFIVGCIVVFGAFTIWKIVVNVGNKAEDKITIDDGVAYCLDCGTEMTWGDSSACMVCSSKNIMK